MCPPPSARSAQKPRAIKPNKKTILEVLCNNNIVRFMIIIHVIFFYQKIKATTTTTTRAETQPAFESQKETAKTNHHMPNKAI
jgi:hypothetical protein